MNNHKLFFSISTLTLLGSCAGIKKEIPYEPEIKKEISYTYSSDRVDQKIKGSHIIINKHPLAEKKFDTQECYIAPQETENEQKTQVTPKPQGFAGLLGGLSTMVKKASSPTKKKSTGFGPKKVTPQTNSKIQESYFNENAVVFNINYKSSINHIVDFSKTTFLLKDPNGVFHKPVSVNKVLSPKGSCGTKEQVGVFYNNTKNIIDFHSTIVLPRQNITRSLAFKPSNKKIKGKWELMMFEVPVSTDLAGKINETDHWYSNMVVKKWETTYKKLQKDGEMKKVKTIEI